MSFDLLSICLVATGEFELAAVLHGAGDALWTLLNAPVLMGPGLRRDPQGRGRHRAGRARRGAVRLSCSAAALALPLADALAMAKGEAPAARPSSASAARARPRPDAKPLTRREKEIAALVAAGLGNREIAARLFLSKRTVDSHIEHIFTKLSFSSRTQLASWVLGQRQGR